MDSRLAQLEMRNHKSLDKVFRESGYVKQEARHVAKSSVAYMQSIATAPCGQGRGCDNEFVPENLNTKGWVKDWDMKEEPRSDGEGCLGVREDVPRQPGSRTVCSI